MQNLKNVLYLLTAQERSKASLLLAMMTIMALIDMIGVASILPFTAVLVNPSLIETNSILNFMFQTSLTFGIENYHQFLFLLGVLVFVLLVISLTFKALTTYAQVRFVEMREFTISKRLIESYLHQPYEWFLNNHSADLGKNILSEVQQLINYALRPLTELLSKGIVAIALMLLLIIVNPILALIIGLSLGGVYIIIFYLLRGYLDKIGKKRLENNKLRFTAVTEAFGAIKEVKFRGLENLYIENFSKVSQIFAKTQASSQTIGQLPRFILEAIAFGGILIIILYLMMSEGSFNNALPFLTLYIFAGYRLMPAFQQIYGSFTQLTFISPSLEKLKNDLKVLNRHNHSIDQSNLSFNQSLILKDIDYNYPNSSRKVLKNINLTIPVRSSVGFVGTTGSGKTTLVDIILGLLEAQNGILEVDGQIITKKNLSAWQSIIGYVPQNIYLSDDSISSNIAFGIQKQDIDFLAVKKAAKIASIHKFIENELNEKYNTNIGERGVRLSGGQRQRIGIARALYHNPKILILDEATSALDIQTEKDIMDSINTLGQNITTILIAHRLNTVKNCDFIFKFEKGEIIKKGNYSDILNDN